MHACDKKIHNVDPISDKVNFLREILKTGT